MFRCLIYIIYVRIHEHVSRTYGFCVCRGSVYYHVPTRCLHIIMVYNIMYLVEKLVVRYYIMSWFRHDEQYDSSGLFRPCAKNNTMKNSLGLCTSAVRGCCAPNIRRLGRWRVSSIFCFLPSADSHGYNIVRDRWTIIYNIILYYYGRRGMRENENLFDILYNNNIIRDRFNDEVRLGY